MTRIALAPEIHEDFGRIFDHLFLYAPEIAAARIEEMIEAINVLQNSPLIGHPRPGQQRELVISKVSSGYLALYRYDAPSDTAYVLAIRGQKEFGYKR